ncbi:origin recognition complex subunit 3-like [Styela clava]
MNNKSLTSVSKGCFVLPAKKKKKTIQDINAGKYFSCSESSKTRWELSQKVWIDMECKIRNLHLDLTANILSDLIDFLKNSHSSNREVGGKRAEIPAAALITGVNMPDHAGFFHQLSEEVSKTITPHVAVLCSKNCLNMKSLMRCIGQQLILGEAEDLHNVSVEDTGDLETDKSNNFIWKRSAPLTMPLLEKWFSQADNSLESKKRKQSKKSLSSNTPPIVIMLRDMESFLPYLLQDLIAMFSTTVDTFPVIFIFGVATSWTSVIDRQLPHSATVHLCLEKFHSPTASKHLAMIIDNILLTSGYSFKLSGKCMQLLLDVFLCHDFSVTTFLHILKFCVLNHFYEQPTSLFCTNNIAEANKYHEKLSGSLLQKLRDLPSVKTYFKSLTTKRKELLQSSDEDFKILVKKMLEDIHEFHHCFYPVMRSLFSLCKSLPRHPLGRHLRELYCACDHGPIVNSDEYKQAKMFLRVSSRDQLIQRLQSCVKELDDMPQNARPNSNIFAMVIDAKSEINSVINELLHPEDQKEEDLPQNEEDENIAEQKEDEPLEKVKYAYQLKENLKKKAHEKKVKKMSTFEKLRIKALEILDVLFTKILLPPRSFPFHEIFYFDSTSTIKRHMIAAPRLAIQTALSDPNCYLQQPCLDATDGVIPPSAPDVSIAYKLHNECGKIINLYDWLEAFHTIVNSGDNNPHSDKENNQNEEINKFTQARFIRAASELQFLGFIKPTKRKTDHVQRLTWSHS